MNIQGINASVPTEKNQVKRTDKKLNEQKAALRGDFDLPYGMTIATPEQYRPCMKKLSATNLFDIQYESATELTNGARLIRPVILSLGKVEITPIEDGGSYLVNRRPFDKTEDEQQSMIMKEDELLKNRSLARGAIKLKPDGRCKMVYMDKDGKTQKVVASKEECLEILRDNFLYI